MATWNRGRHILPSVQSVLEQDFIDFELLVIGDHVSDDTKKYITKINDNRLTWVNLPKRSGTQSGPNNRGLETAKANLVAYCGHDDIWAADHLSELDKKYSEVSKLDAVCSGILLYRDNTYAPYKIEGMFPDFSQFNTVTFTPPSGFSHRLDHLKLPKWKLRNQTAFSVDYEFQSALAALGFQFGSTEKITVHKWLANEKYLSYLVHESHEQEAVLLRLKQQNMDTELARITDIAKATGFFMRDKEGVATPVKDRARKSDVARGIKLPPNVALGHGLVIPQDSGPRPQNWHHMPDRETGLRWCGPSTTPRILLPVTHAGVADISIDLVARSDFGFPNFYVLLNGNPIEFILEKKYNLNRFLIGNLRLSGRLNSDRASVLHFKLPDMIFRNEEHPRERGFAMGEITIKPKKTPQLKILQTLLGRFQK